MSDREELKQQEATVQPVEKKKGRKRQKRVLPNITLDLNRRDHRMRLGLAMTAFLVVILAFLYGNYRLYTYTESAEFCGSVCHPMDPQFVRYEESPHSKVECVDCHIGPGTTFFVKSKIDGMRQVYAVLTNSFSRPIKSPVHSLRPARETCETCHDPSSFRDNIIKNIVHYDEDEQNTPVRATLILKMGGWQEGTGVSQGIHWHITNPVYYIAADEQRQVIAWVGVEQPDGNMKEYFSRDMMVMAQSDFVKEAYENEEVRTVDCIDCHNRAAHEITPPDRAVDDAITLGLIESKLPFIRAKAVEVLSAEHTSVTEAENAIEGLAEFYQTSYPAEYKQYGSQLESSLEKIKEIYGQTYFPEMGLDWQTNPNNQAHTPFLGCFRCHDGNHVRSDVDGGQLELISVKCNLCHTVPIVGRGDNLLIETPVIVGDVPETHADFSWTIEHRDVPEAEQQECFNCHGQGFCNNGACHNLEHPEDMVFAHADEYRERGDEVCYTCHQNVTCSRCHPGGVISNP